MLFHNRNVENEFNLLALALARLRDPEQILYMQREFSKLEQRNFDLEREVNSLQVYKTTADLTTIVNNFKSKKGNSFMNPYMLIHLHYDLIK